MVITPAFWKDKKVFLTGCTGFKGSWLALWLRKLGAEVIGYSLPPPTDPSLFKLTRIGELIQCVEGDIRNIDSLKKTISACRPDIVMHMAAQSLVLPSYSDPLTTFSTNVMGTAHLLEAVRFSKSVRVVVNVTSDKCYENHGEGRPFRETDAMGGSDPYSSSKGCAELITAAYRRSFFTGSGGRGHAVAVATVRAGNVIGGGDWSSYRLVPDVMRAFLAGKPAVIRNPDATRPWQHVLEPLGGYLRLAEHMWQESTTFSDAWNFGPAEHDTRPVSWVTDALSRLWGGQARWEREVSTHPTEAVSLRLECSKAKSGLGWYPQLNLSDALAWTVEWYKAYGKGADVRPVTEKQIDRYQNTGRSDEL